LGGPRTYRKRRGPVRDGPTQHPASQEKGGGPMDDQADEVRRITDYVKRLEAEQDGRDAVEAI
jgi:hypothetical protein